MKVAIALVLLAACDRVYGLDGRADAFVEIDAGPEIQVTGTFTRMAITTSPDRDPVAQPLASTEEDRPIVTSFGKDIAVAWNPVDGTFSFAAPTPYEVRVGTRGWQSSSSSLVLDDVQVGRPSAPIATSVELVATTVAPPLPTSRFQLMSTGVWTRQALAPTNATFPIDWLKGSFYADPPRLVDTTAGDLLLLATYAQTSNPGEEVLAQFATADLVMTNGSQSVTFQNPQDVQPIGCTRVAQTSDADLERLRGVYPSFTSSSAGGWEIDATPLPEQFGFRVPLSLASRFTVEGDTEERDVVYGNLFGGHSIVLGQVSSVFRELEGGTPAFANITHQQPITPTNPCTRVEAGGAMVALPVDWKLAGVPLATDGLTIATPDRAFADVTWTNVGDVADAYHVELLVVPTGAEDLQLVRAVTATEPRVRFPTSLFEPDARYIFRIITRTGMPAAASGDFTQILPTAWFGSAYTSTFQVVQ